MNRIGWWSWLLGGLLVGGLLVAVVHGQTSSGQAPAAKAGAADSPDKVVLKVGNTSITRGQVETLIKTLTPQAQKSLAQSGRRPIGDEYVRILLLSQDALSHHLESTPAYKEMLAIHAREILATLAFQEIQRQCAVTPEEISKYYETHPKEFEVAEIYQVVIRKKPQDAKEGTPGLTAEEAKARAEEIRKALLSGDEPKKLATKYSLANVVRVDAYPEIVHRGDMPEDMEKAAFGLKDGEVSEIFDYGAKMAFIKTGQRRTEELKLVSARIENDLTQQKIDNFMNGLKKKANVWMDDNYFTGSSLTPRRTPPPSRVLFQGPVTAQ